MPHVLLTTIYNEPSLLSGPTDGNYYWQYSQDCEAKNLLSSLLTEPFFSLKVHTVGLAAPGSIGASDNSLVGMWVGTTKCDATVPFECPLHVLTYPPAGHPPNSVRLEQPARRQARWVDQHYQRCAFCLLQGADAVPPACIRTHPARCVDERDKRACTSAYIGLFSHVTSTFL